MSIYSDSQCDVKMLRELENELCNNFRFIKKETIGYSVLRREINAYTIGSENGVLMCGAFHGMERITAAMLLSFLYDISNECKADTVFAQNIHKVGLTVVPMINPDGVEISIHGAASAKEQASFVSRLAYDSSTWQANAHGVDINHNFNADWKTVRANEIQSGYILPGPTRYGSTHPESEPETKAITYLCRQKNFKLALALHSQGREIYYDFGKNTPKESVMIAYMMSQLSGYKVSVPENIAIGGGFKDWFIERFCKPAFTIEVGIGQNPLSPQIFDIEYPKVKRMLQYTLTL